MKTILITGAHGFVGKNLLPQLQACSYNLLTPSRAQLNLLDYRTVSEYLTQYHPDLVINLAGKVGGILANVDAPLTFLMDNLCLNTNIIKAAHEMQVPAFLNLGSSCMYPKDRDLLHEEDLLTGKLEPTNEGYALAKVAATKLCEYIDYASDRHYKTLAVCNLYGPHDDFSIDKSHLIPAVINKIHRAKAYNDATVTIWGDGKARREFMYVADLVSFIVFAIENMDTLPSIINVGLGYDYSIDEYYQNVAKIIGYNGKFIYDPTKPKGMHKKIMSVARATALGWTAQTSLQEGLQKTYDYYRNAIMHQAVID